MKHKFARPSRKGSIGHTKGHPGIYDFAKEICPAPQKVYVQFTWNMPIEYATAIQDMYPGLTMNKAIRAYICRTIQPKDIKEI